MEERSKLKSRSWVTIDTLSMELWCLKHGRKVGCWYHRISVLQTLGCTSWPGMKSASRPMLPKHLRTQHVALLIPRHTENLGKGSPPGWNMGSSCWWACRTLQLLVCLLVVPWLHRNCLPDLQGLKSGRNSSSPSDHKGCFFHLLQFKAWSPSWMCSQSPSLLLLGPDMSARLLTSPHANLPCLANREFCPP